MSFASAISRAEPAVSAPITGFNFSSRMTLRHWPSAMTWLCTVLIVPRLAPFGAINWLRIGRNHSPMMCSFAVGIRWWMSATRPATEFSIGIMPRSTSPFCRAVKQSSKVGQGTGS